MVRITVTLLATLLFLASCNSGDNNQNSPDEIESSDSDVDNVTLPAELFVVTKNDDGISVTMKSGYEVYDENCADSITIYQKDEDGKLHQFYTTFNLMYQIPYSTHYWDGYYMNEEFVAPREDAGCDNLYCKSFFPLRTQKFSHGNKWIGMREYPVDFEYHGTQTLPDEISEFKTISLSGEIEIHIEYYTTSECERDSFRQEIHTITL